MTLNKKIYALLSILCFHAFCKSADDGKSAKKLNFIIDVTHFVQANPRKAQKKLSFGNKVRSAAKVVSKGKIDQKQIEKEMIEGLFKVVAQVQPPVIDHDESKEGNDDSPEQAQKERVYWNTTLVPPAMVSWLRGKVRSEQILQAIKQNHNQRMHNISTLVFDPEQCADILDPCDAMFDLAERLQDEGHTVHALGNWPSDVKACMLQRFGKQFSRLNGSFVVSGELDAVKCDGNTNIYDKFLTQYLPGVQPQEIYLVEQKLPVIQMPPQIPGISVDPDDLEAHLMQEGFLSPLDLSTF